MGLFDLLHSARQQDSEMDERTRAKLYQAWGLSEENQFDRTAEEKTSATPLDYDRIQWIRKLRHVLSELPDSEDRWETLVREGRAKQFEDAWMRQFMLDEFAMLVRQAVADRVFTDRERQKLEVARLLIGLNETEANAIYTTVIREAETFFGEEVEGA